MDIQIYSVGYSHITTETIEWTHKENHYYFVLEIGIAVITHVVSSIVNAH